MGNDLRGKTTEKLRRAAKEKCDGCKISWKLQANGFHMPPADAIYCAAPDIRAELRRRAQKDQTNG